MSITEQHSESVTESVKTGELSGFAVTSPAATGLVYRQGAHVADWTPAGAAPVFWVSEASEFAKGAPIRGGIPIAVPWFGPGLDGKHAPNHGWGRIQDWELVGVEVAADGAVTAAFTTNAPEGAENGPLELRFEATFGATFRAELTVRNAGSAPTTVESAFHTYWAVGDVRQVSIVGLDDKPFLDRSGAEPVESAPSPFPKFTGQLLDRIYPLPDPLIVRDPAGKREFRISGANAAQTIVWNPGAENAKKVADFEDDDWLKFVAVEVGNVREHGVELAPGASTSIAFEASVAPLD